MADEDGCERCQASLCHLPGQGLQQQIGCPGPVQHWLAPCQSRLGRPGRLRCSRYVCTRAFHCGEFCPMELKIDAQHTYYLDVFRVEFGHDPPKQTRMQLACL